MLLAVSRRPSGGPVPRQTGETGPFSNRRFQGALHVARGEEAEALAEYTSAAAPLEYTHEVGHALNSYLRTLSPDDRQKYWSDPELRKTTNREVLRKRKKEPPSWMSRGRAWEYLGDEYMHRCMYKKARAAYAKASECLGADYTKDKLAWVSECEPD